MNIQTLPENLQQCNFKKKLLCYMQNYATVEDQKLNELKGDTTIIQIMGVYKNLKENSTTTQIIINDSLFVYTCSILISQLERMKEFCNVETYQELEGSFVHVTDWRMQAYMVNKNGEQILKLDLILNQVFYLDGLGASEHRLKPQKKINFFEDPIDQVLKKVDEDFAASVLRIKKRILASNYRNTQCSEPHRTLEIKGFINEFQQRGLIRIFQPSLQRFKPIKNTYMCEGVKFISIPSQFRAEDQKKLDTLHEKLKTLGYTSQDYEFQSDYQEQIDSDSGYSSNLDLRAHFSRFEGNYLDDEFQEEFDQQPSSKREKPQSHSNEQYKSNIQEPAPLLQALRQPVSRQSQEIMESIVQKDLQISNNGDTKIIQERNRVTKKQFLENLIIGVRDDDHQNEDVDDDLESKIFIKKHQTYLKQRAENQRSDRELEQQRFKLQQTTYKHDQQEDEIPAQRRNQTEIFRKNEHQEKQSLSSIHQPSKDQFLQNNHSKLMNIKKSFNSTPAHISEQGSTQERIQLTESDKMQLQYIKNWYQQQQ